jgi:ABC-type bacteriocin/lantibiotic exporter with double-glycine peptidase domain
MVRSLVGYPKIILFDDANANFDLKNDGRLLKFMASMRGKRTMVVVSHRPSFLRLCDRNFIVENRGLRDITPKPETADLPLEQSHG